MQALHLLLVTTVLLATAGANETDTAAPIGAASEAPPYDTVCGVVREKWPDDDTALSVGYCTHHCTVAPQVPAAAKARRAAAGDASAADATGGDGADDAFDLDAELDKIIGLDAVKDM